MLDAMALERLLTAIADNVEQIITPQTGENPSSAVVKSQQDDEAEPIINDGDKKKCTKEGLTTAAAAAVMQDGEGKKSESSALETNNEESPPSSGSTHHPKDVELDPRQSIGSSSSTNADQVVIGDAGVDTEKLGPRPEAMTVSPRSQGLELDRQPSAASGL